MPIAFQFRQVVGTMIGSHCEHHLREKSFTWHARTILFLNMCGASKKCLHYGSANILNYLVGIISAQNVYVINLL